ncbi:hypothetical protein V1477_016402 [Vespula maculifrons]|uniref:Uncharacterized protein n=1 Tax=Vespula maculifrons TaxID=7453 RepID=A0ABD2BCX7_VESMC
MVKVDTSFEKVLPLGPRTRLDFLAVATVTDATTEQRGEEALEFMKNSWKPSGAILGIMLPLLSISYYCQGGHPTSLVLSELAFQGCFPEGWGFRLRPTEMLTAASCLQVDFDRKQDDRI